MSQPNEKPSFFWVFFTGVWHIAISIGICLLSAFGRSCWSEILPGAPLPLPTEYAVMPHLHISMAFLILLAYMINLDGELPSQGKKPDSHHHSAGSL